MLLHFEPIVVSIRAAAAFFISEEIQKLPDQKMPQNKNVCGNIQNIIPFQPLCYGKIISTPAGSRFAGILSASL